MSGNVRLVYDSDTLYNEHLRCAFSTVEGGRHRVGEGGAGKQMAHGTDAKNIMTSSSIADTSSNNRYIDLAVGSKREGQRVSIDGYVSERCTRTTRL